MFGRGGDGERLRNHQPGPNFHGYNCTGSRGTGACEDTYPKQTAQRRRGESSSFQQPWERKQNHFPIISTTFFYTSPLVWGQRCSPPPGIRGDEGGKNAPVAIASAQSVAASGMGSDGNRMAEGWEKAK